MVSTWKKRGAILAASTIRCFMGALLVGLEDTLIGPAVNCEGEAN